MDVERALLSKVIQTQAAEQIIARGIDLDHFSDNENREVWTFILDHLRRYKSPPSYDAVRQRHPDFRLEVTTDALDYLMDRFIQTVKRRLAIELGRSYRDAIDDPDRVAEIELIALEMARTLTEAVPSPSVGRFSDVHSRIAEYNRKKEAGEVMGILTGFPTFDNLTLGIQPHEFVVIMAFLGVGKSTMMQRIFYEVYLQGKTPMMMSLEMDAQSLLRKFDSMATQIRYWALKALELGEGDMREWEQLAERADAARHEKDIIIIDDVGGCTVDKVLAETIRYKPDLVGIDYVGLMDAPRGVQGKSWEKVTYITRALKSNARSLRIPILAAAQANREGGRGEIAITHTAEALSIARDCDMMIGLQQDEEQYENKTMEALLLKNRDGKRGRAELHWDLDIMDIHERTLGNTDAGGPGPAPTFRLRPQPEPSGQEANTEDGESAAAA